MDPTYSIICPFRDEKGNLPELHKRLSATASGLGAPAEILFVDDGSTDGGGDYFKGKTSPSLQVIEFTAKFGKSAALRAGMDRARGSVFVLLDADMQVPPEEMLAMIPLLEQADLVTGIRLKRRDRLWRKAAAVVSNYVRRAVLGDAVQDIGCDLRVFRREVARCFYSYEGIHRFFTALAAFEGFRVRQIPVRHESRRWGRSKYGLLNRSFNVFYDLLAVRWMMRRKIRYEVRRTYA